MHMQSAHGGGTENRNIDLTKMIRAGARKAERRGDSVGFNNVSFKVRARSASVLPSPARRPPTRRVRFRIKIAGDDPSRHAGQPHARAREMGRRFGECGFDIRHVSVWRFVKIRHDSDPAFGAPCTFIPKSSHEHQHSLQVSPALGPKSGAASSRARRPPVPRRAHRTAREAATMPWSEGKLSVGKTISLT